MLSKFSDFKDRPDGVAYFLVRKPFQSNTNTWQLFNKWLDKSSSDINFYLNLVDKRKNPLSKKDNNLNPKFLDDSYKQLNFEPSNLNRNRYYLLEKDGILPFIMRANAIPQGQVMAVITEENGVYRVERGYIPGKNPNATFGTKMKLPQDSGPYSLRHIVDEAVKFEREISAPVVIIPDKLSEMIGEVIFPPNAYWSVELAALDNPLEDIY